MKRTKGITLLALVITIVIMLLLAGVALQMAMGENGLIVKSTQAKKEQAKAELLEIVKLNYLNLKTKAIENSQPSPEYKLSLSTTEFLDKYNIVADNIVDKQGNIIETKQEILNTLKMLYPHNKIVGGVEIPESDKDKMILKLKVLDETKEIYFGALAISESLTPIKIDYGNGIKGEIENLYDGKTMEYNRGEYIIKVEETGYFAMGGHLHSFLGEGIEVEILNWGKVTRSKEYFDKTWNIRIPNVSKIYEPEPEEIVVFYENAKIAEIPKDLFKYNTEVESFLSIFNSCESLKNIPRNLINNNSKIKDIRSMFYKCKELETIPIEIINKVMNGLIDYECMFYGCTKADNYNNLAEEFKKPY